MGKEQEMGSVFQAEFQKLPEEKKPIVEKLLRSSLVRTVVNIENRVLSPKEGLKAILADEEFLQLWEPKDEHSGNQEQKKYFEKSRKAYAEYLAYKTPFSKIDADARIFAASDIFRDYISYIRRHGEPGQTFLTVLELLPSTDLDGIKFIAKNREVLANLDYQYFFASGRKDLGKNSKDAAEKAKKISDILLMDAIFLPLSNPEWREFVIKNFPKLFALTSMVWFSWEDIRNYDPVREYENLKKIFKLVDPKKMPQILDFIFSMRSIFSKKSAFSKLLTKIEEETNGGNLTLIKDVSRLIGDKTSPLSSSQAHWLNEFWEGKITLDRLKSLQEKLKSTEDTANELEQGKKDPLSKTLARAIRTFSESDLFLDLDYSFILDNNIFPTELIIQFLKERGQNGIKELVELKEKTKRGEFDPNNQLQKDLEYMSYLTLRGQENNPYAGFSKVDFVEDENNVPILDSRDIFETQATAFEAARVYWIIRERADMGKKLFIIGNNRYGKLFVTDPLTRELELLRDLELIDGVGSKYVRSHTGKDMKRGSQIFSDNNMRRIASETPDIIVIDGTSHNIEVVKEEELPRFSSAMMGFYNWVKEFNEGAFDVKPRKPYGITFKSFFKSENVVLGDKVVPSQSSAVDEPQIIIINSTINPRYFTQFPEDLKDHEAGYFDDPENNVRGRKKLVFTKKGLEEKDKSDETEYTHAVQALIENSILQMILRKEAQLTTNK